MTYNNESYFIGVDVGTGSARACVIDAAGEIRATHTHPISKWEPRPDYFNQSSTEIWDAVCLCVRTAIEEAAVDPTAVRGIGFDATCSLVVLDEETDEPISVGPDFTNSDQNIVLWMDHRAGEQTDAINASGANLLKYVGGGMSIEMEIPKAKWLKDNMPAELFARAKFYDLPDFLTHRATGSEARSFCSVVCKQGYVPVGVDGSKEGWSRKFLNTIGLGELAEDNFRKLGGVDGANGTFLSAGEPLGFLTQDAAEKMGLTTQVAVGSAVIDCYAGWIGTIAARLDSEAADNADASVVSHRLAAVAGTSTCHLVMSQEPVFVPGVWGPYRDVVFPGKWLAEGGQSCTGELLHHVLTTHPSYTEASKLALTAQISVFEWLNDHLEKMAAEQGAPSVAHLARHFFFYGDLHGNRSPIADPRMKGSVIGLDMNSGADDLAIKYYAAVEFIGLQTRHIIDSLNKAGHAVTQIYLSGGQCRNGLLTQTMATATGLPVVIPHYIDAAVVLGSAMMGARAASGGTLNLWEIMRSMTRPGTTIAPEPKTHATARLLNAKYTVFLDMAQKQQEYRALVDQVVEASN